MKHLHHNNVTNILATASTPPPASRARHHFSGPSTRLVTRGDSDDDSANDEPALVVLRDKLRSTTEKSFECISPKTDGLQRRESSFVSGRRKLSKDASQGARPPGLRHEHQTSSRLLKRWKSDLSQFEPISCAIPRYRVERTKPGTDTEYFQVEVTVFKLTWRKERSIDEFFGLRHCLVRTATDLAKAAAKKEGNDGGAYSSIDFRRVGEERVPDLNVNKTSWREKTPLRSILFRRSREEILAEKQVLLASWLANVLADSTLMSADVVRFLHGDVAAQPVLDDAGGTDVYDAEASKLWNTSGSDLSGEGYWSYENDVKNILDCAQAGVGVSPYPPQGSASTRDQRERLARDTTKRVALIRDDSPTFPEHSPIISLGHCSPSDDRVVKWGDRVVECFDAKFASGWWRHEADDEEDEYDEEDDNVGDKPVMPEPTVSPSFISSGHWSYDSAMRGSRKPSPSSPTTNEKLDAFFLAPA